MMTDSPVVGSASFELRATRDKLKQDLRDSEAEVKKSVGAMERDAGAGADRVGASFGKMGKAIGVGIAAVVAVAAAGVAIALQFGQASLKMADTLANSADRIGVSTAALQEWQYVARKTGEDANSVSGALENFANKVAAAAAGLSKEDLKSFKSIGLDQEQLRGFKDTEAALDQVIDRIGALKSESDRAAISEKLGLGPLATALREGSDEVARLRDEAQALGFVMDEDLIRKGAQAQGQLEDLAQVIGIQMAEAFIGLSDEVLTFTGYIADALKGLNAFIDRFREWRERADLMYGSDFTQSIIGGRSADTLSAAFRGATSGQAQAIARAYDSPTYENSDDPALLRQQMAVSAYENRPRGRTRSTASYNSGLTVPVREDKSAERAAEREARRAERVEQEIYRARQRLLRVAEDDILTAQQRYDLAQDQLKMDREARDAEIQSKADRGEIKAAERQQLEAANASADALEDRLMADNAFREIQDERLATEKLLSGLTADLLSLQSGAARTAKERQRIELELLEITQKQRRDALQLQLDRDPSLTQGQRADAMATNGRIDAAEREAVARNNLSPLAAWRDESLKTADEIAEAYEDVAARGLDSLNDGITDAILNSRSLGEVFTNVANSIISDLARIAIRQSITEPLANWLFGDGKSSGKSGAGNLLSSIGSFFSGGGRIPGFSSGVTNFSGGLAYVHAGEMLTNLAPGTSVIPAHTVSAMGKGGGPYFDLRGAVMTQDLLEQMNQIGRTSESRANHWSTTNVPGLSQSQTAKQQQHTVGRKKR